MEDHIYRGYLKDGFTDSDIEKIWEDTLYFRKKLSEKKEERDITSLTYIKAQNNLTRDVKNWFGRWNK